MLFPININACLAERSVLFIYLKLKLLTQFGVSNDNIYLNDNNIYPSSAGTDIRKSIPAIKE